jgi:hypothetical protein
VTGRKRDAAGRAGGGGGGGGGVKEGRRKRKEDQGSKGGSKGGGDRANAQRGGRNKTGKCNLFVGRRPVGDHGGDRGRVLVQETRRLLGLRVTEGTNQAQDADDLLLQPEHHLEKDRAAGAKIKEEAHTKGGGRSPKRVEL